MRQGSLSREFALRPQKRQNLERNSCPNSEWVAENEKFKSMGSDASDGAFPEALLEGVGTTYEADQPEAPRRII
jgi:hypothetical protein